jgi:hypothetical protein
MLTFLLGPFEVADGAFLFYACKPSNINIISIPAAQAQAPRFEKQRLCHAHVSKYIHIKYLVLAHYIVYIYLGAKLVARKICVHPWK